MFSELMNKLRGKSHSALFKKWELIDFIAPQDVQTIILNGKEQPETALMRFSEYAQTLFTGEPYAQTIDFQKYGIPGILYIFGSILVYHGEPQIIKYSNFMVFEQETRDPIEARIQLNQVSELAENNPELVVQKFSEYLKSNVSTLKKFVENKYGA